MAKVGALALAIFGVSQLGTSGVEVIWRWNPIKSERDGREEQER